MKDWGALLQNRIPERKGVCMMCGQQGLVFHTAYSLEAYTLIKNFKALKRVTLGLPGEKPYA